MGGGDCGGVVKVEGSASGRRLVIVRLVEGRPRAEREGEETAPRGVRKEGQKGMQLWYKVNVMVYNV